MLRTASQKRACPLRRSSRGSRAWSFSFGRLSHDEKLAPSVDSIIERFEVNWKSAVKPSGKVNATRQYVKNITALVNGGFKPSDADVREIILWLLFGSLDSPEGRDQQIKNITSPDVHDFVNRLSSLCGDFAEILRGMESGVYEIITRCEELSDFGVDILCSWFDDLSCLGRNMKKSGGGHTLIILRFLQTCAEKSGLKFCDGGCNTRDAKLYDILKCCLDAEHSLNKQDDY